MRNPSTTSSVAVVIFYLSLPNQRLNLITKAVLSTAAKNTAKSPKLFFLVAGEATVSSLQCQQASIKLAPLLPSLPFVAPAASHSACRESTLLGFFLKHKAN